MDFTIEFVSRNLVTHRILSDFEIVKISYFLRYQVSGDTWYNHVNFIWHPMGVTYGMNHVVHLCERFTLSHVSNEEIMGKRKKSRKIKKDYGDTCDMVEESGESFSHFDKIC